MGFRSFITMHLCTREQVPSCFTILTSDSSNKLVHKDAAQVIKLIRVKACRRTRKENSSHVGICIRCQEASRNSTYVMFTACSSGLQGLKRLFFFLVITYHSICKQTGLVTLLRYKIHTDTSLYNLLCTC